MLFLIIFIIIILIYLYYRMINDESNELFWSYPIVTTFRLSPNEDLMEYLLNLIKKYKMNAVSIITCVGSLKEVHIRLASASSGKPSEYYTEITKNFEIVSLVGTLEYTDTDNLATGHLHISLADEKGYTIYVFIQYINQSHIYIYIMYLIIINLYIYSGNMIGGHLMKGCKIYTTAEITVMKLPMLQYKREYDELSGYEELKVIPKKINCIIMIIHKLQQLSKSIGNFLIIQQNRFLFQNTDKNTN